MLLFRSAKPLLIALTFAIWIQAQTPDAPVKISGKVGHAIRLGAPIAGPGTHWSIIGRPTGSRSVLVGANSPAPSFFPDKQGIYVLRGVGNGGATTILAAVGPGHTLAPVQTRVLNGDHYDIVVDGAAYPGPEPSSMPGINIVVLRRDDLQLVDHFTSPGNQSMIKDYLDALLAKQGADVIVIIATNDSAGFPVSQIAPELKQFGANTDFDGAGSNLAFSLIGIKGTDSGQAYQVGSGAGQAGLSLNGYFAPDSHANYAFIQIDYVTFQTIVSPNPSEPSVVVIADRKIAASQTNACMIGGFLLAIVDRASLNPTFSQTYCTPTGDTNYLAAQLALTQKLKQEQGIRQDLIFLVSFGDAHLGLEIDDSDFARLAQTIGNTGGTYEAVFQMNHGDTYSLVTSGDPEFRAREVGSLISSSQASGNMKGVLSRGRLGNWYAPAASTTGVGNLGLYQILSQPAKAFPVPVPGDAGQQQAFSYINQQLCGAECASIRSAYEDTNIDLDQKSIKLFGLRDPQHPDIDCDHTTLVTDFCIVRGQLLNELGYAANVRDFDKNISGLWTDEQSNIGLILTGVTGKVNQSLQPPPQSKVPSIVEGVIGGLLSVASKIPGPSAPILGILSGAFSFGTSLANNLAGNSTVLNVNVPASNLASQAADSFAQQNVALGTMMDLVYEDWGKLQALGTALNDSQDPNWFWNGDTTTGQLLQGFNTATEISDYASLLPSVWTVRIWNAQTSTVQWPWDYTYNGEFQLNVPIFSTSTPPEDFISEASPRTDPATLNFEPDIMTLALPGALPFGVSTHYPVPQAGIPDHLYGPQGLGVWKPDVFRHWQIPVRYCTAPGDSYVQGNSNCDQKTPQLPQ